MSRFDLSAYPAHLPDPAQLSWDLYWIQPTSAALRQQFELLLTFSAAIHETPEDWRMRRHHEKPHECVEAQAYFVFSVGNLTPIFEQEYPRCWRTNEQCSKALLSSIHYTQASLL